MSNREKDTTQPNRTTTTTAEHGRSRDHTVTPYDVAGDVNYDRVREQFGAAALTDADVDSFPEPVHQLLRRRVFYAGRDVRRFTEAAAAGDRVSVVTGVGPSGPMHLLLPQLVDGPHPTLVPVAVDQDPHVRVSRDVAGKDRYDVTKPAALLSKFLPRLDGGGGKMSSSDHDSPESVTASDTDTASATASDDSAESVAASDDGTAPPIYLDDDRETVERKFQRHAYSGGKSSVEAHRREGGNPAVDVAYRFLHAFFEPDDEEIERIAEQYRDGSLLSGELKQRAADAVATFLERHRERRPDDDVPVAEAVDPYRLRADERARLRNDL